MKIKYYYFEMGNNIMTIYDYFLGEKNTLDTVKKIFLADLATFWYIEWMLNIYVVNTQKVGLL